MEHNELTTYIAELKQTLLPKFHLSNESINHLKTYCRYRLGDRWEIPVSHYHFWINMANDKDSQELAIYIFQFLGQIFRQSTVFYITEQELLDYPEQLLEKEKDTFIIRTVST